jgi:biopolymer transport protein ExbD
MSELQITSAEQPRKRKKLSTRVDLTPMVDLGFLLITFFIFTTKMEEPHAMKLKLPKDTLNDSTSVKESETINIVLGADNTLFYYTGNSIDMMSTTVYTAGIRRLITEKRNQMINADKLTVLIKPMQESSFKNVVDILDEMLINQVKRYVLMEPAEAEIKKVIVLKIHT